MAREDVNIKVSADVAEAIRMWRAMQQGPEAMARELEATGRKGKAAASGMASEWGKLIGTWTTAAGAIGLVQAGIMAAINAQKQLNQLTKDASAPLDSLQRKFANQTGATNQQMDQARSAILNIAANRAVTPETAFSTATQLASSGFSREEASGKSLDAILKLANATNIAGDGADVAGIAGAVINFLQATKQPATPQSLEKAGLAIHGLFKGTDLQAPHLAAFAPKAGVIASMTGMKSEQLPILSQFLEMANIDVAGTAMKASLSGLATAGKDKSKIAALKKLGLKPEDVDFVGEGFLTVQEKVVRGFESVPENEAKIAAAQIFGQEGALALPAIFSRDAMQKTRQRMATISSGADFRRAHEMTEGSQEALDRVAATEESIELFKGKHIDIGRVGKQLRAAQIRRGSGAIGQAVGQAQLGIYNAIPGFDAEDALRATLGPGQEDVSQQILDRTRPRLPADVPAQPSRQPLQQNPPKQQLEVKVSLMDQDAIAIPHKSEISKLNQATWT